MMSPYTSPINRTANITMGSSGWSQYNNDNKSKIAHDTSPIGSRWLSEDASLSDLPATPVAIVSQNRLSLETKPMYVNIPPTPRERTRLTLDIQPGLIKAFSYPDQKTQTVQTPNRNFKKGGQDFLIPGVVRRKSLKDLGVVRGKPIQEEKKMALPEFLQQKLGKVNQKISSQNYEFENLVRSRIPLYESKKPNYFKTYGQQMIEEKYESIVRRKRAFSVSPKLYTMTNNTIYGF